MAIFENASSIQLDNSLSLVQVKSQGGIRQAQRRGPYLYNFTVSLVPMKTNADNYIAVTKELRTAEYGVNNITTKVPADITKDRGNWFTSGNILIDGANQMGSTIDLKGFSNNSSNVIRDGDYMKFNNGTKVYQAVGDYNSDSTGLVADVKLNTPLVLSPADSSIVTHGEDVRFTLALVSYGDPLLEPSTSGLIAYWGEFTFEEVIER